MNPTPQSQHNSRHRLAVGIWSVLSTLMVLDTSTFAPGVSIGLMFLISILCSVARILIAENRTERESVSHATNYAGWNRYLPNLMTVLIPLLWAINFTGSESIDLRGVLIVIAMLPALTFLISAGDMWQRIGPNPLLNREFPNDCGTRCGTFSPPFETEVPSQRNSTHDLDRELSEAPIPHVQLTASEFASPIDAALKQNLGAVSEEAFETGEESLSDEAISIAFAELTSQEESELYSMPRRQDSDVQQWFTRSKSGTIETVKGGVTVVFEQGQRETSVHVAFCPPLSHSPEIMTEDLDGNGLEISVAASFPFGARFSIRRSGSSLKTDSQSERVSRIGYTAVSNLLRRVA